MKRFKTLTILALICCCLSFPTLVPAESQGQTDTASSGEASSGGLSSDDLMKGLMGILQQGIDEFIGSYKGRLGDVKLLERLGNKIVLEVTYDNVKRSDNVYVQGEVRYFGEKLEGFKNTLSAVSGSRGKAVLTIGRTAAEDDGWGMPAAEVQSDQIRLYLVRGTNPDRPFGEIIYDLPKLWTDSDLPDAAVSDGSADSSGSDSIELADEGEEGADTGTAPASPGIFVKPGTVLKPRLPGAAGTAASTQPALQTGTQPKQEAPAATLVQPLLRVTTAYDFYKNANKAQWRSGAGKLPFPGRTNDKRGFVRQVPKAALSTGNAALYLLQTHPQWKSRGWIQGIYPPVIPAAGMHFKAVAGFLKGATASDGAIFQVHVKEGGKTYRALSRTLSARRYATLDADLSRWSGKKIQIILQVIAGNTSAQDWAVWVKPRLEK
ncbi:MAG: hypothetical protein HUN04_11035 [Desulfobacter sp.]|nr:MAG: hypothetical protein HUN04_11035 [Desulfobacter sp.]